MGASIPAPPSQRRACCSIIAGRGRYSVAQILRRLAHVRTWPRLDKSTTFEDLCVAFERAYDANVDGVICERCHSRGCEACKHATGWHLCDADRAALAAVLQGDQQPERRWKAGTLHAGTLDIHNSLWNLSRRLVPLDILKEKFDAYIAAGDMQPTEKDACVQVFEQMRNDKRP